MRFASSLAVLPLLFPAVASSAVINFDLSGYLEDGLNEPAMMTGRFSVDDQAQSTGPGILGGTSYSAPITAFEVAFGGHSRYGDVVFTGSGGKLDIFNSTERQGDSIWIHDLFGNFAGTYQGIGRASLVFTMRQRTEEIWDSEDLANVRQIPNTNLKDLELTRGDGQRMVARVQSANYIDERFAESPMDVVPNPVPPSGLLSAAGLLMFGAWKKRGSIGVLSSGLQQSFSRWRNKSNKQAI